MDACIASKFNCLQNAVETFLFMCPGMYESGIAWSFRTCIFIFIKYCHIIFTEWLYKFVPAPHQQDGSPWLDSRVPPWGVGRNKFWKEWGSQAGRGFGCQSKECRLYSTSLGSHWQFWNTEQNAKARFQEGESLKLLTGLCCGEKADGGGIGLGQQQDSSSQERGDLWGEVAKGKLSKCQEAET